MVGQLYGIISKTSPGASRQAMGARTCGNMGGGNTMQDNIKKSESLKTDNFQKMVDQIIREDAELLEALKNL